MSDGYIPNDRPIVSICVLRPAERTEIIQTTLYVGADASTGEVQAVEMIPQIPGQQGFDGSIQQEPKIMKIAGGMR